MLYKAYTTFVPDEYSNGEVVKPGHYVARIVDAELQIVAKGDYYEVHIPETVTGAVFYAERFDGIADRDTAEKVGTAHALARGWMEKKKEATLAMRAELKRLNGVEPQPGMDHEFENVGGE